MSSDVKRYKLDTLHLEKWTFLLMREQSMTKALIQDCANGGNGKLPKGTFDVLCRYYTLCGELTLLIDMFLDGVTPNQKILELHKLEYITFKKIATTVSDMKKELKADYNICLEIN